MSSQQPQQLSLPQKVHDDAVNVYDQKGDNALAGEERFHAEAAFQKMLFL